MAQSNVSQNLQPNEFELKDLLDLYKKDILLNFNCHHVGTVEKFDSLRQVVQVTINYTKTFFEVDPISGIYSPKQVAYPVIVDAPIVTLGGANGMITFPIAKGDECIVFFNDRDIDNWFMGSSNSAVSTGRLHSFSDAIVLVGPRSLPNVVLNYATDAIEVRNNLGTSKLSIKDDEVKITLGLNNIVIDSSKMKVSLNGDSVSFEVNSTGKLIVTNLAGEFVAALVTLFQDIATGTVICAGPGNPSGPLVAGMPTYVADLAKLQTFKS